MAADIQQRINTNTTATISSAINTSAATSTTLIAANLSRIYLAVFAQDKDIWLKFQAASVDDDKKGIFLTKGTIFELPMDNIYTGEVSAIANVSTANVYVTEY